MSKFDDMMDYGKNRERFNDLKRKLDTIIPFVGAGLSAPFGFPQWKEFLLDCCENDDVMKEKIKEILGKKDKERYELAASYLANKLGMDCFQQKVCKAFDKDIPLLSESPIMLFRSLFKQSIITTNFDHVIENLTNYKTVLISQKKEFSEILRGTTPKVVLKLHGDVKNIENIILTKEQYDQSYLEDPEFQEKFANLLMCKTFLFLGCSLDQDRTMEFMSRAKSLENTRYVKNYAFMASPAFRFQSIKEKTEEIQNEENLAKQEEKEIEERLGKVNILPIWYPEKEYQWIWEYLNWLQRKDYFELFQNLLDAPLFLEDKYEEEEKLTLDYIYTEPSFAFFDVKKNILEDSSESLLELIRQFIMNLLSNYSGNTLFILGEPGIGKSSLVSKIVSTIRKNNIYCVRLRDLDKKEIKIEGALNAILNILSIEDMDLTQKTLILDGVDELCGIENYEKSIDDFCFSLMEEASRLKFKLLFTSRLNYVHLEDKRFNTILVLKLLPFREKQFKYWFEQYHNKREGKKQTHQPYPVEKNLSMLFKTDKEEEKKKLELFGIPLVLYLLVELQVDISKISSLGQLYDKLFEDLERRFYDGGKTDTLPELLYKNCKEVAKHIAKKMFDTKEDMLNSESYREAIMLLPDELKSNLNDILDYEHFYLLSFYYRMNKEKCSVEFIHKSLMEYLVGEMLYYNLLPILNSKLNEEKQKEELQKELDKFFAFSAITDEICLFFLEKVKENGKQQQLFSLLKKYYKFYLEVGFIYEINNSINSLNKIQNLFISYWKLLRILANTKKDNLLEEEKDLFCSYLTKISFKNIDLSYQNLAKTKLRRADLRQADLRGAKLTGADLTEADLRQADLTKTDLTEADLRQAYLSGADLFGTDLFVADLFGFYLRGTKLRQADLRGAKLSGTDLSGTDLSRAYLSEVDLFGTDLRKANLSRAYLSGADLRKADLRKADLSRAYLSRTKLKGAKLPISLRIKLIFIPFIIILSIIGISLYFLFFK